MSTQPNIDNPPSIPPPQTNSMILQHRGMLPKPTGVMPGEIPDMNIEMARAQLLGKMTLTTDTAVGTELSWNTTATFPLDLPILPNRTTGTWSTIRGSPAFSCQFYFHQNVYWDAEVVLHLWAVKPPQSIGRLRVIYTPPEFNISNPDPANREITKVWDLSLSNIFEFKVPSYNMRSYRNCVANCAPLNGFDKTTSPYRTPVADYKVGRVRIFVTHLYQPGSIFPNNCNISVFQSFQKPQFAIAQGPAVPLERTALTQVLPNNLV